MLPRYEPVNPNDDDTGNDGVSSPSAQQSEHPSSPPSFHSRASSPTAHQDAHHRGVSTALADAFESDDVSDDEDDVRQRLVNGLAGDTPRTEEASAEPARRGIERQVTQLPLGSSPFQRIYGGGVQSDGVFSNLSARPEPGDAAEKDEQPPTYEQAAADAAPPYWETTILAPGLGGPDEVYLDGMPVGSLFGFLWNSMVSMFFQLPGFVLTYLLHATHAAKNGSRAGLGVTLIKYGFDLKGSPGAPPAAPGTDSSGYSAPSDPNSHNFDTDSVNNGEGASSFAGIPASEWLAYVMMVVGWFILIRAVGDYLRARRHEQLVLQSPERHFGVAPVIAAGEPIERIV